MKKNLSPIAFFVYNRPKHTKKTLTFLKKNKLAKKSLIYIFSDEASIFMCTCIRLCRFVRR